MVSHINHAADAAAAPPASATLTRRFYAYFAVLLLLGLLVRLPFLPRLGHAYDQDAYRAWMGAIQDHGLGEVFERTNTDYVGYHYILWTLAQGYGGDASQVSVRDKSLRVWLKVPGLIGDLLTFSLVLLVTRSLLHTGHGRRFPHAIVGRFTVPAARLRLAPADLVALAAGALYLFHPAVIYAGSYWGQQDSLVTFFMLLASWLAWRRRPAWAGVALAVGTIVKPQPLVLGPLLAWIVWRRSSWRGLIAGGIAGTAVLAGGHAYFLATGNAERMLEIYAFQITQTEHLSFGAYNLWWPFERLGGARPDDAIVSIGGLRLTYGIVATALVLGVLAAALYASRRGYALQALIAAGVWLAGYYLVAAGSHERYALPALAFLLCALPLTPRLRGPLLLYSVALFANLLIALPMDRRWPQGDPVWLTIAVSLAMVFAVVWLLWAALTESALTPDPAPHAGRGEPRPGVGASADLRRGSGGG